MKYNMNLDWNYLRTILFYCPWTGIFQWKLNIGNRGKINQIAGFLDPSNNYWSIGIDNKRYRVHQLAWYYMFGEWPEKEIDHKNTIKDDNKFINLRLATNSQNGANKIKHKNNTSGYKGVTWDKQKNKWCGKIMKNYKTHFISYYNDPIEAAKTYDKKAIELFGEFAKLNFPI